MLTMESGYGYTESLKTTNTAFNTPSACIFYASLAWMRAGNIQYRPKHLLVAFSESTPLLILNGDFLRKTNKMTNAISVFKFNQNQIRTKSVDGNPYFCLPDVCLALGLKNSRMATSVKDVKSFYTPTKSGNQNITFINEPNLYRLIFRSNKPQAQAFADWVYSEVLPSIRKTGGYGAPTVDMKAIGGLVKKCCAVAVREELAALPNDSEAENCQGVELMGKILNAMIKNRVQAELNNRLEKIRAVLAETTPSGMPFANWAVSAVHAVGAMQSEYQALKQKQQQAVRLLENKAD